MEIYVFQSDTVAGFSNKSYNLKLFKGELLIRTIYNSPSNTLQSYASFQRYLQRYDRSRRQWSSRSPGMNGLNFFFQNMCVDVRPTNSFDYYHKMNLCL